MHRVEYELRLSTGETVRILELDAGAVPELSDADVAAAAGPVLGRCPRIRRDVLEEAKMGHTKGLESAMGTPPLGHLLKMERPVCSEVRTCSAADPGTCTARNSAPGRPFVGRFPVCWEFEVVARTPPRAAAAARALASVIVNAWREDRRVLIVTE